MLFPSVAGRGMKRDGKRQDGCSICFFQQFESLSSTVDNCLIFSNGNEITQCLGMHRQQRSQNTWIWTTAVSKVVGLAPEPATQLHSAQDGWGVLCRNCCMSLILYLIKKLGGSDFVQD